MIIGTTKSTPGVNVWSVSNSIEAFGFERLNVTGCASTKLTGRMIKLTMSPTLTYPAWNSPGFAPNPIANVTLDS